jgi:Na+/melibiose symporter-like transporter
MPTFVRVLAVAAGNLLVFAVVVLVLTHIMPGNKTKTDYLVIGGVATFVSMIVLFIVLITGWTKSPDTFFRKRSKNAGPSA